MSNEIVADSFAVDLNNWVRESKNELENRTQARERIIDCKRNANFKLDLSGLDLTSLPSVLSGLDSLSILVLDRNKFTKISDVICHLSNLTYLSISENSLTEINPDISRLSNLKTLILSDNQITEFPVQVVQIPTLEFIHLSKNLIKTFPDQFFLKGDAESMKNHYLYLAKNDLSKEEIIKLETLSSSKSVSLIIADQISGYYSAKTLKDNSSAITNEEIADDLSIVSHLSPEIASIDSENNEPELLFDEIYQADQEDNFFGNRVFISNERTIYDKAVECSSVNSSEGSTISLARSSQSFLSDTISFKSEFSDSEVSFESAQDLESFESGTISFEVGSYDSEERIEPECKERDLKSLPSISSLTSISTLSDDTNHYDSPAPKIKSQPKAKKLKTKNKSHDDSCCTIS